MKAIHLSSDHWWQDIEKEHLPRDLKGLLTELINARINHLINPSADSRPLLSLAKSHLSDVAIHIGGDCFSVGVYTPNDPRGRSFFALIPHYPNASLKRLSEV